MIYSIVKVSVVSLLLLSCSAAKNNAVKINKNLQVHTKVIAHRGAWKHTNTPQNSIAAFKEAIKMGCFGSEMDVQMTTDGYLVVNHDNDFKGTVIQKSTLSEVRKNKLSNGEEIPLLEDFLKIMQKQSNLKLVIEIKNSITGKQNAINTTRKIVDAVTRYKVASKVLYISFGWDICTELRRLQPGAIIKYLSDDKTPEQKKAAGLPGVDYHYSVLIKNPQYLCDGKKSGLESSTWVVDDRENMEWLIDQGINYITTDEPQMLFDLLKERINYRKESDQQRT